jgi:co-chaperonin GroES (HSP10)
MDVRPIGDYVALRTEADQKKSAGGIFLPLANVQKMFAEVIALPDPVPSFMTGISVGDKVMFTAGARQILEKDSNNGQEVIFVPYFDILGVIND